MNLSTQTPGLLNELFAAPGIQPPAIGSSESLLSSIMEGQNKEREHALRMNGLQQGMAAMKQLGPDASIEQIIQAAGAAGMHPDDLQEIYSLAATRDGLKSADMATRQKADTEKYKAATEFDTAREGYQTQERIARQQRQSDERIASIESDTATKVADIKAKVETIRRKNANDIARAKTEADRKKAMLKARIDLSDSFYTAKANMIIPEETSFEDFMNAVLDETPEQKTSSKPDKDDTDSLLNSILSKLNTESLVR